MKFKNSHLLYEISFGIRKNLIFPLDIKKISSEIRKFSMEILTCFQWKIYEFQGKFFELKLKTSTEVKSY